MKTLIVKFVPVLIACAMFTLTSCDKEEENPTPSTEALLTAHSWKFSDLTMDSDHEYAAEDIEFEKGICMHNKYTFNKDHTLVSVWNAPNLGSWSMSTDGKKLTIKEPPFQLGDPVIAEEYDVISINETTMVLGKYNMYFDAVKKYTYIKG